MATLIYSQQQKSEDKLKSIVTPPASPFTKYLPKSETEKAFEAPAKPSTDKLTPIITPSPRRGGGGGGGGGGGAMTTISTPTPSADTFVRRAPSTYNVETGIYTPSGGLPQTRPPTNIPANTLILGGTQQQRQAVTYYSSQYGNPLEANAPTAGTLRQYLQTGATPSEIQRFSQTPESYSRAGAVQLARYSEAFQTTPTSESAGAILKTTLPPEKIYRMGQAESGTVVPITAEDIAVVASGIGGFIKGGALIGGQILLHEPLTAATSFAIDKIAPPASTGFAPSGFLPQVGRGAAFAATLPATGAAYGYKIFEGMVTNPLKTGGELLKYVWENPYEVGTMTIAGSVFGKARQVLKNEPTTDYGLIGKPERLAKIGEKDVRDIALENIRNIGKKTEVRPPEIKAPEVTGTTPSPSPKPAPSPVVPTTPSIPEVPKVPEAPRIEQPNLGGEVPRTRGDIARSEIAKMEKQGIDVGTSLVLDIVRFFKVRDLEIPQEGNVNANIKLIGIETKGGRALVLGARTPEGIKFGTPKVIEYLKNLPKTTEIKIGSALETRVLEKALTGNLDIVTKRGQSIIPEAQTILRETLRTDSKFTEGFLKETERLPESGVKIVLKLAKEKGGIVFGSFSRAAQLSKEYIIKGEKYKLSKIPRDIDIRFDKLTAEELASVTNLALKQKG